MTSLASAKGPSLTSRSPPRTSSREPAALGARPAVSSRAPESVASPPRRAMASIRPGGGGVAGWAPLSRTRYRMAISSEVVVGWIGSGGPVAVDRHGGQPSPDEDDGGGERQVADRVAGTGDHAGEPGEERRAGDARGPRPAAAPFPGVATGDDEAGR